MFYYVAIIAIVYLLFFRSTSVSGAGNGAAVIPSQTQNTAQAIPGAAIYMATANGIPGLVVSGPTGSYGTMGPSQLGYDLSSGTPVPIVVTAPDQLNTGQGTAFPPDVQPVPRQA